jgi:hypothetical protein
MWYSYCLRCYDSNQPEFYFESDPIKVVVGGKNPISPYPISGTTYGTLYDQVAWQEEVLIPHYGQERMITFCELSCQTGASFPKLFTEKENWTCQFGEEQLEVSSAVEKDAKLLLSVHVPRKKDTATVPVTFNCVLDIGYVAKNNLKFTYIDNVTVTEDGRIYQKTDCHESNENENVPNESLQGIFESHENWHFDFQSLLADDVNNETNLTTFTGDWYVPEKIVDKDGRYHKKRRLNIEDAV